MKPLWMNYPDFEDDGKDQEFLFGDDFLVAPKLYSPTMLSQDMTQEEKFDPYFNPSIERMKFEVSVNLPRSVSWYDYFNKTLVDKYSQKLYLTYD